MKGFLLACFALLLVFFVEYCVERATRKDFLSDSITVLLFLLLLTGLVWIWILTWKPEQAGLTSDRELRRNSPNVIQIVIDTLGGKYLDPGLLGQYPAFNEVAKDGFQFVRAYSTASCTSWSVLAILTSSFNFVSSGRQFDEFGWLDENEITTAEIFKEVGYETVGFSANPVTSEAFDYNQGFDHFRGIKGSSLLGVYILKALGTQKTKFAYQYGLVDSGFYYQDIKDLYYKLESYLSNMYRLWTCMLLICLPKNIWIAILGLMTSVPTGNLQR